MHAKYQGPYKIIRQLGPVDYLIATPDKRKSERVCHVNMLKHYVQRNFLVTSNVSVSEHSNSATADVSTDQSKLENKFKLDQLTTEQRSELQNVLQIQIQMGICRARLTNCPGALTNVRMLCETGEL